MSDGYGRNAELSRAALIVLAGAMLVGVGQRAPGLSYGLAGKAILVIAAGLVVFGLVTALRILTRRSGGADQ